MSIPWRDNKYKYNHYYNPETEQWITETVEQNPKDVMRKHSGYDYSIYYRDDNPLENTDNLEAAAQWQGESTIAPIDERYRHDLSYDPIRNFDSFNTWWKPGYASWRNDGMGTGIPPMYGSTFSSTIDNVPSFYGEPTYAYYERMKDLQDRYNAMQEYNKVGY